MQQEAELGEDVLRGQGAEAGVGQQGGVAGVVYELGDGVLPLLAVDVVLV